MSKAQNLSQTISSSLAWSISRSFSPASSNRHKRKMSTPTDTKNSILNSSQNFPNLYKIKNRTMRNGIKVNPETAAQVIKDFLIPMFNYDNRNRTEKLRKRVFGLKDEEKRSQSFSEHEGTVYAELNLSTQLNREIQKLREKNESLQRKVYEITQEKESINYEYEKLKEKNIQNETNIFALNLQCLSLQHDCSNLAINFTFMKLQLEEYKEKYDQCFEIKEKLSKELHEEKAGNDKLRNKAIQLEHGASLLVLENEIMGERLKGLFTAFDHIAGNASLASQLENEIEILRKNLFFLASFNLNLIEELNSIIKVKDSLLEASQELSIVKDDLKNQRDRIVRTFKENAGNFQRELQTAQQEREKYKLQASEFEKKFGDLNQEYNRLRMRLKSFQHRFASSEADERICKNCQRPYTEKDNFNWSCRTHPSKIIDDIWFCCGKIGKEASGCVTSKHISKEDDEFELNQTKTVSNLCTSCREFGHIKEDCPKDPNTRTKFPPVEELERITENLKRKNKISNLASGIQEKVVQILETRLEGSEFAKIDQETNNDEEDKTSNEEKNTKSFWDLEKLKAEVTFDEDETSIKIDFSSQNNASMKQKHQNFIISMEELKNAIP
ncbi:unnamed protein product [Blepharisma stoltei]|uniref:CCHC-type domain-containing protein n=1 Tax=Blepharisma stoltei TaxID=1481888 RepID=A0AAU9K9G1_9CILI|nr:unnamed protein product [Blepharisma stoltei]